MANRQADRDGFCSQEPLRLHGLWAKRHAWALRDTGDLLVEALRKDTSAEAREVEKIPEEQIPAQVVRLILEKADPTRNKGMTAWLVRQYGQGHLRLEDLGTANETLAMFRRYAPRLGPGQRDLGRYQNLAAVWEAVIGFANDEEQRLSGKAQKALDRDKAYAESRILRHDPDGFTIAVPLTEFAAKWWGRGTRWCTAAEKDNRFWQYHKDAPLIIVVIPELKEKGKFQIWATEGDVQFMDAADERVSNKLIVRHWSRFERVLILALRQSGLALEHVPEELRTDEISSIAVSQHSRALEYVPWDLRTEDMCRIAVAQKGLALEYVPWDMRTEDLCCLAVEQIGEALHYVPRTRRTDEMCRIAVAQDGWALGYVPEDLCTEEMCRIAVAQDGRALQYVPEALRTDAMCRIAVAQNGKALNDVPHALRTDEICRMAVTQNGLALTEVLERLRTDEMCRIAVTQNGGALQYVPKTLRDEDMCRIAVAQNGWALEAVPSKLRTKEMYSIAVARDGFVLQRVPEALRTEEMCRIAVAQIGWALIYVPEALRTEVLCRLAVAQNGGSLAHVPEDLRTEELCGVAVAQDGQALESVPDALRSEMQHLAKLPQPSWDLAILDQWAELMMPEHSLSLSGGRHA